MINIEGIMRAHLQAVLGIPVYVAVPADPPETFATVERTGSANRTRIGEQATVVVDYWAPTRSKARELADRGDGAALALQFSDGIVSVSFGSTCIHYPDPETGGERYESAYFVTTYEYPKGE